MRSLLYVSKSALPPDRAEQELARIVEVGEQIAASLDVTGGLIATGDHFAEILEGPPSAVQELMHRRLQEDHHRRVTIIDVAHASERAFPSWSLCYAGGSRYVDRQIGALVDNWDREGATRLRDLIEALAAAVA